MDRSLFKIAVCAFFFLAGCSAKKTPEPEAKELPAKNAPKIDTNASEEELFNNGKRYYSTGLYTIAKDSFQSLLTRYPTGPYGSFAELKIADAELKGNNFGAAATQYEQFAESHPSSPEVPYALFRAAQSHLLSNAGTGRDPAPLEKALTDVEKLLTQYPLSPYSGSGRQVHREVVERLEDHEKLVRDYYAKKNVSKAVEAREQIVRQKWEPLKEKVEQEAKLVKVPSTESVAAPQPQTPELLSVRASIAPEILDAAVTEPVSEQVAVVPDQPSSAEYRIEKAVCRDNAVYLQLNKPFALKNFVEQNATIKSDDNVLGIILPSTRGPGIAVSCFGDKDLILGADGIVSLKTDKVGTLMTLDYPPRVVILLK